MNITNLTGRLTKDIELRTTQSGKTVANFTLAVNRRFKSQGQPHGRQSMNITNLTGRLTKDIELRTTQSGKTVANFTLAVNRRFKSQGQPDADFFRCQAWGKTAEVLHQYTHKGSQIGVSGRLQNRSYENQQGQKVEITEVIVESMDLLEAEVLHQYTHKGSQIGVSGRLQNRSYENQQGQKVEITEVIVESMDLLDKRETGAQGRQETKRYQDEHLPGNSEKACYGAGNGHLSGFDYDPNVRPSQGNPYSPDETLALEADDLPF